MAPRATEEVTEILKRAAESVRGLPEDLREAAFHDAVRLLTEEGPGAGGTGAATKRKSATGRTPRRTGTASDGGSDHADQVINGLDRTAHPQVAAAKTVGEQAMWVLYLADQECGIDGLTAPEVTRVLKDKFRLPVKANAVRMALTRAGRHVDTASRDGQTVFRITAPGETHLTRPQADGDSASKNRSAKKRGSSNKTSAKAASSGTAKPSGAVSKGEAKTKSAGKGPARKGPKAIVAELIDQGFFAKPREMGEVIAHVRDKTGRTLRHGDLSPTLLRLLREEKLDRERDPDSNQYRYTAKS